MTSEKINWESNVLNRWMKALSNNPKPLSLEPIKEAIDREDTATAVIIAHTYTEINLRIAVSGLINRLKAAKAGELGSFPPENDLIEKYQYMQLLNLARYLQLVDTPLYIKLKELNSIRNDWAHALLFKEQLDKAKAEKIALEVDEYISQIFSQFIDTLQCITPKPKNGSIKEL